MAMQPMQAMQQGGMPMQANIQMVPVQMVPAPGPQQSPPVPAQATPVKGESPEHGLEVDAGAAIPLEDGDKEFGVAPGMPLQPAWFLPPSTLDISQDQMLHPP